MDGRYYNWHRNDERHAALLALREEYVSQMKALEKGAKTKFDDLDKRFDRLVEANNGEKNGTFTNLTAKKARLERNVANAERNIAARQAKIKAKVDAIKAKYNKMAERVEKSNVGEASWERRHLSNAVKRRGEEVARNIESAAREGSSWPERKRDALLENKYDLKNTSKEINALQKFKSEARPKIQSAREANRYLAERSSNIKKATPDMVGGRFRNLTGERKEILNKVRTGSQLAKQRADAEQRKADNIIGRYRDMAGRIEKRGIGNDPFVGNRLANRVRERGEDLARPHSEKSSGYIRSWADRSNRLSNEYSKSVDREEAAKEALKNYRSKRK